MELLYEVAKEHKYKIKDITRQLYNTLKGIELINKIFDKENNEQYKKIIFFIDIDLFQLNNPDLFEILVNTKYIPCNGSNNIYIVNKQRYVLFERDEKCHKSVFMNFLDYKDENENICNICFEKNKYLISCIQCDFLKCQSCTDKLIEHSVSNIVLCPNCRTKKTIEY